MASGLLIGFPFRFFVLVGRRFAVSLFSMQLLWSPVVFSQRSSTSFALLADHELGFRPNGLAVGPSLKGRVQVAVTESARAAIHLYEIGGTQRISAGATLVARSPLRFITSADLNQDRIPDYVALAEDGRSVSLFVQQRGGEWKETRLEIASQAERCVVADLNNDGRNDLLLFGRSSVGVSTVLGVPQGRWKQGPVLFPDVSVSDLKVRDLNRDGVNDIFALSWLANELMVFYGISGLVYTEHVTVPLEAEPHGLSLSQPDPYGTFYAAIACVEAKKVFIYSGNTLGDYRQFMALYLDDAPLEAHFAFVNSDSDEDLVVGFSRGIYVAMATPAGFAVPVPFGVSRSLAAWSIADVDLDQKSDCVMLDEASERLIIMLNAEAESRLAANLASGRTAEYAVGVGPLGLMVADFNGDGWSDVAVANEESRFISLLLNQGRGKFSGQIALPTFRRPGHMRLVSSSRGDKTLVVAHPSEDVVSVVPVLTDEADQTSVTVPTGDGPRVVFATQDSARLKFVVRYHTTRNRSVAISLFEQIADDRFVEQSLRTTLTLPIGTMDVAQSSDDGSYDLVYTTYTRETLETTLWRARSEKGMQFSAAKPLFSFSDSAGAASYLFYDYVNKDGERDAVVVAGHPTNAIGVWYGGTTAESSRVEWIRNIRPKSEDAIVMKDINGDDVREIVCIDDLRDAVVAVYGLERRGQPRVVQVAPARGAASLRIAGLRGPSNEDLVLSYPERGTIAIVTDPFRK
ncbi:MAG TPA: VCBS repeat-containing protein [Bacteroidota bacterium]|nr:VCBS repeat-containing protein [Bacteroidota bacterium]